VATAKDGKPVYLVEFWPSRNEIEQAMESAITSEMFRKSYARSMRRTNGGGGCRPKGETYGWEKDSTYIRQAPYFDDMALQPSAVETSKTRGVGGPGRQRHTDHISPAGSIKKDGPAGKYLIAHGVQPGDFNSYGSRRGNHEVMVRGTFATCACVTRW